jgi:hypothetical protein
VIGKGIDINTWKLVWDIVIIKTPKNTEIYVILNKIFIGLDGTWPSNVCDCWIDGGDEVFEENKGDPQA